jgi:hypothetical protein
VFENSALRRIFRSKKESGENCITRNFMICALRQVYLRVIKSRRMRLACSTNGEKRNAYALLVESQRERDH